MQSHGDQEPMINIDMQEYEKLLRSSIHTLIVSRKRKTRRCMLTRKATCIGILSSVELSLSKTMR
jgi:hypothetical protein